MGGGGTSSIQPQGDYGDTYSGDETDDSEDDQRAYCSPFFFRFPSTNTFVTDPALSSHRSPLPASSYSRYSRNPRPVDRTDNDSQNAYSSSSPANLNPHRPLSRASSYHEDAGIATDSSADADPQSSGEEDYDEAGQGSGVGESSEGASRAQSSRMRGGMAGGQGGYAGEQNGDEGYSSGDEGGASFLFSASFHRRLTSLAKHSALPSTVYRPTTDLLLLLSLADPTRRIEPSRLRSRWWIG
jgi:hypothetical protein